MPLVSVTTTERTDGSARDTLLAQLSRLAALHFNKPEDYVMTSLVDKASMTFGGQSGPTCYIEVKNIGKMTPEQTEALSVELCRTIYEASRIPKDRIYIEFSDERGYLWGHDGHTFA